jgi:hypothetical protein
MDRFEVTDPAGVLVGGKRIPKGDLLPASATGSQLKAWQRFNQVKPVKPAPARSEPEETPEEKEARLAAEKKAKDDAKAAAEKAKADAKAAAEAEKKAKDDAAKANK